MKKNDARRDVKDLALDKAKDAKVKGGAHIWTARNF